MLGGVCKRALLKSRMEALRDSQSLYEREREVMRGFRDSKSRVSCLTNNIGNDGFVLYFVGSRD